MHVSTCRGLLLNMCNRKLYATINRVKWQSKSSVNYEQQMKVNENR